MKAVGNWVLVKLLDERHGHIISKNNSKGRVHSSRFKELKDKIVHFKDRTEYFKVGELIGKELQKWADEEYERIKDAIKNCPMSMKENMAIANFIRGLVKE